MSEKIVIYGLSAFSEMMYHNFTKYSDYTVVGFCVDQAFKTDDTFCNLPVIAFEQIEKEYPVNEYKMFVAIGFSRMRNRALLFNKAKAKGYSLVNFISPQAIVRDDLVLGENNVIQSSVDIDLFVTIGNNNVFWTGSILGHNLVVGSHNYVSGNCGLGGNCLIGDACFIGNAAVMVNNITIANESYLVAGTVIVRDTEAACQYHGNPSKRIACHADTGIQIS
ncbi:acetyltransferase [methanotrophic endosymbiont of Bathymodiolus puteoserpentis (Logatchev)]|jgi:sugar O-acyltransferase (sialic acid O-acetyltransferase NeuD family)|uniref:acetyltransferase n=1 Tax=methanotrophic endosymbiont of Bathymodiolus puteoserpentis (Logatchev) TaxID=343235 RepID=UPI0013CDD453|nr:acetyltransferase [methanotrophic endosymbiont of Bathymodiolus puteoserpentis (Logatchev)]SHE23502.1 transferase, putative [methanotrophic endosymbiont of Bathymodiolus puteoserpentis (Logatchev)]